MRVWTNLQCGGQYAEAVKPLVELRVCGTSEERLPKLRLTFGLRCPTERTDAALLACTKEVAQGRTFTSTFDTTRGKQDVIFICLKI